MAKIKPTTTTPTHEASGISFANNEATLKDMYENEIVKKRHNCTDILCLILFVVFVLVQVVLSIIIYANAGSPANLLLPHDSNGNLCKDSTPELFYFDLLSCLSVSTVVTGCPTPSICVPTCPSTNLYYLIDSHRQTLLNTYCVASKLKAYYNNNVPSSVSSSEYLTLVQNKICPMYALNSAPYFHRCLPSILSTLANSTDAILANDTATGQSIGISNGQGSVTGQLVTNALNAIYKLLNLQTIGMDFSCYSSYYKSFIFGKINFLFLSSAICSTGFRECLGHNSHPVTHCLRSQFHLHRHHKMGLGYVARDLA